MFRTLFFLSLCIGFFTACRQMSEEEKKINQIPMKVEVTRFDSLFNTPSEKLSQLTQNYPFMFPHNIPDSVWVNKQKDTLQQELYEEVSKQFRDFTQERKSIEEVFRHIKYYFPKFQPPKVITLTSDVDYHSRVIYADSLLLIGLDNYLGKDHRFYENIQKYIRFEFEKKYLPVDVAEVFTEQMVPQRQHISFLDAMVYEGKKLYLMHKLLPQESEADVLKYDNQKWKWAEANESEMWRYFIENELLYQTDKRLLSRFIHPAPFSKFYLELDQESPGQAGRYIGLKIVDSFMKNHPKATLTEMLAMKPEELFKQSRYKPKK